MIICPKCKVEIEADSYYCDQCGQEIRYCQSCHKVGKGNRCTACGGHMIAAKIQDKGVKSGYEPSSSPSTPNGQSQSGYTVNRESPITQTQKFDTGTTIKVPGTMRLILSNTMLGLSFEGVDGAVIGRKQGIYANIFANYPYVSGSHAQLKFDPIKKQWMLTDMNSSNGSKYNGKPLIPNTPCMLENGGTVQLANIVLTVAIM